VHRYLLSLQAQDHTGQEWLNAFGEAGDIIMVRDLFEGLYEHTGVRAACVATHGFGRFCDHTGFRVLGKDVLWFGFVGPHRAGVAQRIWGGRRHHHGEGFGAAVLGGAGGGVSVCSMCLLGGGEHHVQGVVHCVDWQGCQEVCVEEESCTHAAQGPGHVHPPAK
jgi:hypothetical protein